MSRDGRRYSPWSLAGFLIFLALLVNHWLLVDRALHALRPLSWQGSLYAILVATAIFFFFVAEIHEFSSRAGRARRSGRVWLPLLLAAASGGACAALAMAWGDRIEVVWRTAESETAAIIAQRREWHGQIGFLLGLYLGLRAASRIWPAGEGPGAATSGPSVIEHRFAASLPEAFARDMEEARLFLIGAGALIWSLLEIRYGETFFVAVFSILGVLALFLWLPYFWTHIRWIEFDADRLRYRRLGLAAAQIPWSRVRAARHDRRLFQRWVLTLDKGKVRLSAWPFADATWARIRTEMYRWLEHASIPVEDDVGERPS